MDTLEDGFRVIAATLNMRNVKRSNQLLLIFYFILPLCCSTTTGLKSCGKILPPNLPQKTKIYWVAEIHLLMKF